MVSVHLNLFVGGCVFVSLVALIIFCVYHFIWLMSVIYFIFIVQRYALLLFNIPVLPYCMWFESNVI